MSEWQETSLPAVLEFREGPGIMAADFMEAGTPLIRLAGLKRGVSLLTGCNYLDPAKVERRWAHFRLRTGDALLSTSASLGEVATVTKEAEGSIPYTGIILFRPADARVDPHFIPHMLRSPSFKAQIAAMGVGSVMKHFGPSHLRHMTVAFPSLRAQRAIAEVLKALDDKIAANDRLVASADALAEVLTLQSANGATERIDEVAQVVMGSSPPGETYNESGEGVPFFQGVRDFGVRFPRERVWTSGPVRMAAPGDTLVSVRAPVGRTNLAPQEICIGRGIASLRCRRGRPSTLFHQVRAAHASWAPYEAEGTVFGSINKQQLAAIELPGIDPVRAESLEEQLGLLESRISAALSENSALERTRDELLPLLMSGKLHVNEADERVEEVV